MLGGSAGAQLAVLVFTVFLARMYTPTVFGQFAVYSAICATVVPLAALRYDVAVMLPKHDSDARVLMRVATVSNLVISGLTSLVTWLAAQPLALLFGGNYLLTYLPLTGLSVFTLAQIVALGNWLNRQANYQAIAFNKVLQNTGVCVAQILLWVAGLTGLGGLLWGSIVGQAVALAVLWYRARDGFTKNPARPAGTNTDAETSADAVGVNAPASDEAADSARQTPSWSELMIRYRKMPLVNGLNALVDAVRLNGITLLIGTWDITALGQFNMAWRIVQAPVALINGAISQVFFRHLAKTQRGQMHQVVAASVKRSLLLAALPFLLLLLLAPWLFPLIFGAQWAAAGYYAQALTMWLYLTVATSPISNVFVVMEAQQYLLAFGTVFMIVPLTWLYFSPFALLATVWVMASLMAGLLLGFIGLALWAAKRYDGGALSTNDAERVGGA